MDSFLFTVISFVVALGVLISVHEYGHFWVARKLGVKVLRFSIGFGKALWQRTGKVDGTEYVLAAVPLGGYVKMLDEREAEVAAEERHRAFFHVETDVAERIVAENPENVEKFKSGKDSLIGWFVGQVMKATGGKANPKAVNELVAAKLGL